MSKKFSAIEHIAALNTFKTALQGSEFSESQLADGLKQCGIPSNKVFRSELKKSFLIKIVSKDRYMFSTSKPIYFKAIDNIYQNYQKKIKQYRKVSV